MALVQDSKADFVLALNRESATALSETGLTFSVPSPGVGNLAQVRLTSKSDYTFRGTKVIEYHRRDLATLPGMFPVYPRMDPKATLYEMLTSLRDSGVLFTTDDLVDGPVVTRQDGNYEVQLTAKPASLAWFGTGLLIFQNLPPISLAIKEFNLNWS
ncbi:hypothetical protein D3C81_462940 [compost metagenome]